MANHKDKMKTDVILINPPARVRQEHQDDYDCPHLGLGYLSAYLRENGFVCKPIDSKFEGIDLDQLTQKLKDNEPMVIGITAMTHDVGQAAKVAKIAKELFPGVVTVLGGPHATALPEETLKQFQEFDVAVVGEGEIALLETVKAIKQKDGLNKIAGVVFRSPDGIIVSNERREFLTDLDSLPLPAWDLFPPSKIYPIIMVRGCPFRCNFCMRVSGSKIRKRSPKNIMEEFSRDVNQYGARMIKVYDESFGIDKEETNIILDSLISSKLSEKVAWTVQTRADLVNEELLAKFKKAGCTWIGFGVESANEKILEQTGKGITLKQVEESVAITKKAGIPTGSFFIFGHPYETKETIWDTIDFAAKLNTSTVAFGIMVPYPGTKIYEMALKNEGGYRMISSDWADFNKTIGSSLELEGLPRKEMEKLQLWAYFIFYYRNRRVLDFLKLLWQERRIVKAITKKIFIHK